MKEIIGSIRDLLLKVPTTLAVTVALMFAAMLFMPSDIAQPLGVDEFRNNYRYIVGPTLLIFIALVRKVLGSSVNACALSRLHQRQYGEL